MVRTMLLKLIIMVMCLSTPIVALGGGLYIPYSLNVN
jgi:hypothetical protein